jgi:ABC-2 type transport system permease protein
MLSTLHSLARRQLAFNKKGFLIDSSYRTGFALDLCHSVGPLVLFFFASKLVNRDDPRLSGVQGNYLGFVCVGLAMARYFAKGLNACASSIRRAQSSGVLEATLSTRTSAAAVVLHEAVYQFGMAVVHMVVLMFCATAFLHLDLSRANWPVAILGFVFASIAFLGLSIASASFVLRLKNGDPVQLVLGTAGAFVAGVYFPVELLPSWLQLVASFIPMTHALNIIRRSLLAGAGVSELRESILVLGAMALVLAPTGLALFLRAVRDSRRDGSLLQY